MNYPYYTNLTPKPPQPEEEAPQQGFDFASALPAFSGAVGLWGNYQNMSNQGYNFSEVAPSQTDLSTQPTYTGGQLAGELSKAKARGASGGEIASGALQGASAGAALGPIGAAAGGVIGAVSSVFGGAARKRRQRRQIRKANARLRTSQNAYNQQTVNYEQAQNAQEDYSERLNNDRLLNLYRSRI